MNGQSELYLMSAFLGMARGIGGSPFEHPFDFIKTRYQAQMNTMHAQNELTLIKKVYKSQGIRGFYAGFIANTLRVALKSFYRFPLILFFPNFYGSVLTEKYHCIVATGLSIASAEALIITPFARLKIFEMTRAHDGVHRRGGNWGGYRNFILQRGHGGDNLPRELFRGTSAVLVRQVISWSSFLLVDQWSRAFMRAYLNLEEHDAIPTLYLLPTAVVVGIVNTTVTMPFDTVQTLMQKAGAATEKTSVLGVLKHVHSSKGASGLVAGWRPRLVQYAIHAFFTENLLQWLEIKNARLKGMK